MARVDSRERFRQPLPALRLESWHGGFEVGLIPVSV
jgi:hypothetical protein